MISILAYTALVCILCILALAVTIGRANTRRKCPCRTLAHNQCRKDG